LSQSEDTWPSPLASVASGVRRRPWLIPLVAIIAGVLALGISTLVPDKYEASSKLLFQPTDPPPRIDPASPGPDAPSTPERTAATNLALASAAADATTVRVKRRLRTVSCAIASSSCPRVRRTSSPSPRPERRRTKPP
jgi:hypothetical protein